jgi:hypothetical protein
LKETWLSTKENRLGKKSEKERSRKAEKNVLPSFIVIKSMFQVSEKTKQTVNFSFECHQDLIHFI